MTFNQIKDRLQEIGESHKQVATFYFGNPEDFFAQKDITYPAIICEPLGGTINKQQKQTLLSYKLYFLDLVNLSEGTRNNLYEVISDQLSIAEDFIALADNQNTYRDWYILSSDNLEFYELDFSDACGGVSIDLSIRAAFDINRCQVPLNS